VDRKQDEKRERQRRLFLRYFDNFEASGLDPNAVMGLAFSVNSGVFLRRAIAGMKLFRDRYGSPIGFFWQLEDAPDKVRDEVFKLLKLEEWTKLQTKLRRALAVLLDAEMERRRERDEPHLIPEEKRTRAARAPMNSAHRKALQRARAKLL